MKKLKVVKQKDEKPIIDVRVIECNEIRRIIAEVVAGLDK